MASKGNQGSKGKGTPPRQHQGVHPNSTTQNKAQRQKQAEKRAGKPSRVLDDEPQARR